MPSDTEGSNLLTRLTVATSPAKNQRPFVMFGTNKQVLNVLERIVEYMVFNHIADEGSNELIAQSAIRRLVVSGVCMQTSSRPVDIVLSILGAAGVQDTFAAISSFGKNERFGATLALVQSVFYQDAVEAEDEGFNSRCSLINIPLWCSLTMVGNSTIMPTLSELSRLLDYSSGDSDELKLTGSGSEGARLKRSPLTVWTFDVNLADVENACSPAKAIASRIPDATF